MPWKSPTKYLLLGWLVVTSYSANGHPSVASGSDCMNWETFKLFVHSTCKKVPGGAREVGRPGMDDLHIPWVQLKQMYDEVLADRTMLASPFEVNNRLPRNKPEMFAFEMTRDGKPAFSPWPHLGIVLDGVSFWKSQSVQKRRLPPGAYRRRRSTDGKSTEEVMKFLMIQCGCNGKCAETLVVFKALCGHLTSA